MERAVVQRLYDETCGQPGLVGWLGELLTQPKDDQTEESAQAITMTTFRQVYSAAINTLPNSNIINIISKANHEAHRPFILDLFQTQDKIDFRIDDPQINFLYLNGVIDQEIENSQTVEANPEPYVKFSSPFVQKRLFNYFAYELFQQGGRLYDPFDDLNDTITDEVLYLRALLRRYEAYLQVNKPWIFKDTPRRKTDDRIYEAVYHFNLYRYLARFLQSFQGQVWPEFPTGNGKIDLIIRYKGQTYGLEVKSYLNQQAYQSALSQAAQYGKQLGLREIWLSFFVEAIDDARRQTLEVDYVDVKTKVRVRPVFLVVGVL